MLRRNDTGRWTKPSPAQYPHQWNWDSGFISLGWATFDRARAMLEVESMLAAQWRSGMVPHVHYDPAFLTDYFPGPDRWPGAERQVRHPGELTSGISNPPVLAIAACRLAAAGDEAATSFAERVCGALCDWLGYLFRERRLPGSPLVAVVHPWETGWDNSPRWDLLSAAGLRPRRPYQRLDTRAVADGERPSGRDYDGYIALAEIISDGGFDLAAYRTRTPFVVHDVLFDALTHRAAVELNALCRRLGRTEAFASAALAEFARAFDEMHWNPGAQTYFDYDAQAGRQIEVASAAALAALGGDLVPAERATALLERYHDACGDLLPVPTVPPGNPSFDPDLYWRGPVWLSVNWLVVDGLRRLGLSPAAERLARQTLEAFAGSDYAEYLNPVTRQPRGIRAFSWTAALTLDLLAGAH
ncbi:MAG TPA: trehalase family glycosidase [Candidatus Dormibacteraeota bacterium]|nr:trehalase family glycosidase [Candidatus Dormibacteraeota bacterium]